MEQEQLTLYKLMILYLIEKVDFPLSNSQISEFILDKGYTNYFTVQRAFHELEEENMLRVKQIRNMSHYALSDEGSEAIEMFEYQIPNSIKEDIAQFLKEKEYHGNPINPKGSPVTFHYGYDIVDLIYKSSGMVTQIFTIDNRDLGIRAEYIDVLISRKI